MSRRGGPGNGPARTKRSGARWPVLAVLAAALFLGGAACKSPAEPSGDPTDPAPATPVKATADYIELGRIQRISKFRSGIGHDYSAAPESCRSMKHYFVPASYPVRIYSPVNGTIGYLTAESAGTQVGIQAGSRMYIIFHVNPLASIHVGTAVSAGQQIGTHVGASTYSDIAVREGDRLLSYFDVMTDAVFQNYKARGAGSRSSFIITKAARDADPLTCSGETFAGPGHLENWVELN